MAGFTSPLDESPSRRLFLRVCQPGQAAEDYPLANGLTIGRSPMNMIALPDDESVDPAHARVHYSPDGTASIYPVGTSNEITVNGKPVRELRLAPGVRFRLGLNTYFECLTEQAVRAAGGAGGSAAAPNEKGDVPRIAMLFAGAILGAGAGALAGLFLDLPVATAAAVGSVVGALIGSVTRIP